LRNHYPRSFTGLWGRRDMRDVKMSAEKNFSKNLIKRGK